MLHDGVCHATEIELQRVGEEYPAILIEGVRYKKLEVLNRSGGCSRIKVRLECLPEYMYHSFGRERHVS